jgi:hypothetical protein
MTGADRSLTPSRRAAAPFADTRQCAAASRIAWPRRLSHEGTRPTHIVVIGRRDSLRARARELVAWFGAQASKHINSRTSPCRKQRWLTATGSRKRPTWRIIADFPAGFGSCNIGERVSSLEVHTPVYPLHALARPYGPSARAATRHRTWLDWRPAGRAQSSKNTHGPSWFTCAGPASAKHGRTCNVLDVRSSDTAAPRSR